MGTPGRLPPCAFQPGTPSTPCRLRIHPCWKSDPSGPRFPVGAGQRQPTLRGSPVLRPKASFHTLPSSLQAVLGNRQELSRPLILLLSLFLQGKVCFSGGRGRGRSENTVEGFPKETFQQKLQLSLDILTRSVCWPGPPLWKCFILNSSWVSSL